MAGESAARSAVLVSMAGRSAPVSKIGPRSTATVSRPASRNPGASAGARSFAATSRASTASAASLVIAGTSLVSAVTTTSALGADTSRVSTTAGASLLSTAAFLLSTSASLYCCSSEGESDPQPTAVRAKTARQPIPLRFMIREFFHSEMERARESLVLLCGLSQGFTVKVRARKSGGAGQTVVGHQCQPPLRRDRFHLGDRAIDLFRGVEQPWGQARV